MIIIVTLHVFYILNTLDPQLQDIKKDNRFLKFREENLEV